MDTSTLHVDLVTPEKLYFSGTAEMVTAPGTLGEFGVLPGHAPFLSTLKPGMVTIQQGKDDALKLFVSGGVAEVNPAGCTLLAEQVRDISSLTQAQAQLELDAARKAAAEAITDEEKSETARHLAQAETISLLLSQ